MIKIKSALKLITKSTIQDWAEFSNIWQSYTTGINRSLTEGDMIFGLDERNCNIFDVQNEDHLKIESLDRWAIFQKEDKKRKQGLLLLGQAQGRLEKA